MVVLLMLYGSHTNMAELYYGNKKVLGIKPPGGAYINLASGKKIVRYVIDVPEGTTTITTEDDYYGAFHDARIAHINLPSTLRTVGAGAFSGSEGLKHITIPEGVTALGDGCFSYCSSLETIALPSSLKTIGDGCFSVDMSLKEITLPESLESLGSCFAGCSSLKSLVIPESVKYIAGGLLYECDNMETLVIKCGGPDLVVGDILYGASEGIKVYFEGDPFPVGNDTFYGIRGIHFFYKADNPNWTSEITTSTWGGATDIKWSTY